MKSNRSYWGWTLAGLALAAALFPLGCGKRPDASVLARVGPNEIRADLCREQMARRGGSRPEALDKAALLEEMIDQEALYVRALKAGIDQDPEVRRAWRTLLIGKLKERELQPKLEKVEVSPAELEAAYLAERDRHLRPEAVRLAVLYLKASPSIAPGKLAELQRQMASAREKALSPEFADVAGFGSLAIGHSEDQASRYQGGLLGWIEKNRGHAWLGAAAIEAGCALKSKGEISPVVTDAQGVYLLKLVDRREAAVASLKETEPLLRPRLLAEKRLDLERAFARESRTSVRVVSYPELLAAIVLPPASKVAENHRPPAFP